MARVLDEALFPVSHRQSASIELPVKSTAFVIWPVFEPKCQLLIGNATHPLGKHMSRLRITQL
jgi:hypothetical protein